MQTKKASFEQLDVQCIKDRKIRMVISDKRADRKTTGMIFIDDDGTEMGGVIFRRR